MDFDLNFTTNIRYAPYAYRYYHTSITTLRKDYMFMKKVMVLIIVLMRFNLFAVAQVDTDRQALSSIDPLFKIKDTIVSSEYNKRYLVDWMGVEIGITETIQYGVDINYLSKFAKSSIIDKTEIDTTWYTNFTKTAAQNCHSFALQRVFNFNGIETSHLFTNNTRLGNRYMASLLSTCFDLVDSINTHPKKNLKTDIIVGSILIFVNRSGQIIHSVFYDGEYHSKNGAWPVVTTNRLKEIYKRYWDTEIIKVYQLNLSKLVSYSRNSIAN